VRWAFVILCAVLLAPAAFAQTVTFSTLPRNFQLLPRDSTNTGELRVSGTVDVAGHDSLRLVLYRDDVVWRTVGVHLSYVGGTAPFDVSTRIPAELAEYDLRVLVDDVQVAWVVRIVSGDVYLVAGQSNAQTLGGYGYRNAFIRSFGSSLNSPAALADSTWGLAQAQGTLTHLAVGTWGMELGKVLVENYGVPVVILNGAVGGTTIAQNSRHDALPMNPNTIYGRLLWRATKAGLRQRVTAILWHQGESDTDANWVNYRESFAQLWSDWREDFAPRKVYVFQIHQGCGSEYQSQIREVQRAQPQYFDNVEVMSTMGLTGHDGCHYNLDGYIQMGSWVSRLVARDFYAESDTLDIRPPNVQRIWFTSPAQNELRIRFDCAVSWPADTLGFALSDYIYLDGAAGAILDGRLDDLDPRTLVLTLGGPSSATHVTYLPNLWDDLGGVYEGPFIRGRRGVGALSFFEFPIMETADVSLDDPANVDAGGFPLVDVVPNPFVNQAEIRLTLPHSEAVRVELLDAAGRVVHILADRVLSAGPQAIPWGMLQDSRGDHLPAGLYFVRCRTASGGVAYAKAVRLR
jgi:hypothetical protein